MDLNKFKKCFNLLCIGGRTKNFPKGFSSDNDGPIPIIPYGALGKSVVLYYHNKYHKEMDTIVVHVRRDVWVIRARKIAATLDVRCRICLERRKICAGQMMGQLPMERSAADYPDWTSVSMDLFEPMMIWDYCVKKVPRIYKKVWGVLYSCTLT